MSTTFSNWHPHGVIPALLLPFFDDFEIDEENYRRHLRDAAVEGISAVTVNGHSSEVHACTFAEQQTALEIALEELGDRLPIVNGIYADGSLEATRLAKMSERAGASCLLVFPAQSMMMGGHHRPEMAMAHFKTIADATDLPLILFQYPASTGLGYPFETLLKLFEDVPTIRAIKDWCGDPQRHEAHIRHFQTLPRKVSVLTTHSAWLMSSLTMGCEGLLSGAGSVIADLQVALFEAVKDRDLNRAMALNDRIFPIVSAFYADPFLDMHNRMKEALVLLDRQPRAVVRPPLVKLGEAEIERIRGALTEAELLAA